MRIKKWVFGTKPKPNPSFLISHRSLEIISDAKLKNLKQKETNTEINKKHF